MPRLPQYDSSANINPNIQDPQRNQVDQPFKDVNNVVGTIKDITQHLSDANDVMQETKAKTNAEVAFHQQEQAAQNDPNPDNAEMHIKAINEIAKTSAKGIDNQQVAGKVGLDINQSALLTGIKVQDMFKKKQMFANDMRLDDLATTTAANKANAVSAAAGQQDEDNFMSTIQKNVNTGLITPARGMDLVKQYKVGVVKNKISQNSSTNKDDYKGLTQGLDLKESDIVDKMVKARIKENTETNVKQTLGNRVEVLKKVSNGDLTWRDADEIEKIQKYDPKLAASLQKVFENHIQEKKQVDRGIKSQDPNAAGKIEGDYYSSLIDKFFSSGNYTKEDVGEDVLKLLDASGKEVSKDKISDLLDAVNKRSQTLPTTKNSDDAKPSPMQQAVDSAVNNIKDFVKQNAERAGDVFSGFFKSLAGGNPPEQAKNDAIKTYNVKTYSWLGNLPKEGAVYRDKVTGAKRRLFPDGSAKEEQ